MTRGFSFSEWFGNGSKAALAGSLWLGLTCIAAPESAAAAAGQPPEAPNFAMLDVLGRYHELHRAETKAVVLFFTGNGCPVARQCVHKIAALREKFIEREVAFWIVDSIAEDDRGSVLKEARELGAERAMPFLKDDTQGVARVLGVTRTGTAVIISPKDGRVIYSGAVDDQLSEGASKPEPKHKYLEEALRDFLAGRPAAAIEAPAHGCLITFQGPAKPEQISYSHDVAPILEKHCVSCHSPGNIGPFTMSNYQKVKSKSSMIQETLLSRRMPPWSADTEYGHFLGERGMSLEETRLLLAWINAGATRGEGPDPLPDVKVPPAAHWPLGQPDYIAKIPIQEVPATGVLEYRHLSVSVPVDEDIWLGAVCLNPGNLKVVHHCIVRVKHPNGKEDESGRGVWLQGWAPGSQPERFPGGTGRLLPKGSVLDVEMHYTTMGSPQKDETEIGLYKLPGKPEMVLENRAVFNYEFSVHPGDSDSATQAILPVKRDSLLYAMSPHMHLRGSWMRYEALYPNGKHETLLSVPQYDFNWQTSYNFQKPKHLPAGTWILCTGGFDNSPQNPSNPDPEKRVTWGDQSFNEMFIGFMEIAELPESHARAAR